MYKEVPGGGDTKRGCHFRSFLSKGIGISQDVESKDAFGEKLTLLHMLW